MSYNNVPIIDVEITAQNKIKLTFSDNTVLESNSITFPVEVDGKITNINLQGNVLSFTGVNGAFNGNINLRDVFFQEGNNITLETSISDNVTTYVINSLNTQLTGDEVKDFVGEMVSNNTETNIEVVYDNINKKLNFVVTNPENTLLEAGDLISINDNTISHTAVGTIGDVTNVIPEGHYIKNINVYKGHITAIVTEVLPIGVGEANTITNVGTGAGFFKAKTGDVLSLKTILGSSNIEIEELDNEIKINFTGITQVNVTNHDTLDGAFLNNGVVTIVGTKISTVNIGGGFSLNGGTTKTTIGGVVHHNINFKTLIAGTNISMSSGTGIVTVNASVQGRIQESNASISTITGTGSEATPYEIITKESYLVFDVTSFLLANDITLENLQNVLDYPPNLLGITNEAFFADDITLDIIFPLGVSTWKRSGLNTFIFLNLQVNPNNVISNAVSNNPAALPLLLTTNNNYPFDKEFILRNFIFIGAVNVTTVDGVTTVEILDTISDGTETKINAGTGISISGAGTIASPYVITNIGGEPSAEGEINTGQNLGTGIGVFVDKSGTVLRFKSIKAGANIIVTEDTNDIFVALDPAFEATQIVEGNNVTITGVGSVANPFVINAVGDITNAASLGGMHIFRDKTGNTLNFKGISAGSNIHLTSSANVLTISSTTYNSTNVGATGLNVFRDKISSTFNFRKIEVTGNATASIINDTIVINVPNTEADGTETIIEAGTNITVTGNGSLATPYVLDVANFLIDLQNVAVSGFGLLKNINNNIVYLKKLISTDARIVIDETTDNVRFKLNALLQVTPNDTLNTYTENNNGTSAIKGVIITPQNLGNNGLEIFKEKTTTTAGGEKVLNLLFRKLDVSGIATINYINDVITINVPNTNTDTIADGSETKIQVQNDISITGAGTSASPYVLNTVIPVKNATNIGATGVNIFKELNGTNLQFRKINLTGIGSLAIVNDIITFNIPDTNTDTIADGSETKIEVQNDISISGIGTAANPYLLNVNIPLINLNNLTGGGESLFTSIVNKTGNLKQIKGLNTVNVTSDSNSVNIQSDVPIGNTLYVSKLGAEIVPVDMENNLNNCFLNIEDALNRAKNNDTIYVFNGIYDEVLTISSKTNLNIYLEKGVVIKGITANNTEGFNIYGEGSIVTDAATALLITNVLNTNININLYKIENTLTDTANCVLQNIENTVNLNIQYYNVDTGNLPLLVIDEVENINININELNTSKLRIIQATNILNFNYKGNIINNPDSFVDNFVFNLNEIINFSYYGNIKTTDNVIARLTNGNYRFEGTFISTTFYSVFYTGSVLENGTKLFIKGNLTAINSENIFTNGHLMDEEHFSLIKLDNFNLVTNTTINKFLIAYNNPTINWVAQNYQIYLICKDCNISVAFAIYLNNGSGNFNHIFFGHNSVLTLPAFYNGATPTILTTDGNLFNPLATFDFNL
jgi:hypothetical protein